MTPTPDGSMMFAFQNMSEQNNEGKLALTSGGGPPAIYTSPALLVQPRVLVGNWQGNSLTITNISTVQNTPIGIEAFGPGIGTPPQPLLIGEPVSVAPSGTLKGMTNPNWMQLGFQFNASQLAVFGFIGGPVDATGNNAYVVAVNSPCGDTGPGTGKPAPPGYFATAGGNNFSYEFNWGASVLFVAYFGSAVVLPPAKTMTMIVKAEVQPTVTLLSL